MTLWINGDWITGQGASRVKRNPVSGEVLWQGNDADAAQVEQACRAARAAFPRWARLSLAERQVVVEHRLRLHLRCCKTSRDAERKR